MSEPPRNSAGRAARLATLPFGVAGRVTAGLGKRLGGKSAEVVRDEISRRTADQVFRVLGELKGGAMKFGQVLSIMEAALPEEMVGPYRATLTKLQDAAPAMPVGTVHQILTEELGPHWRRRLRNFDDHPAAAASIGQVHRAQWPDGTDVAVKIQYPGAADALVSDLNQIARLGRLLGSMLPGLEVKPLVAELKERIEEELDYELEAAAQQAFATAYEGDPDIAIPSVRMHTDRVLVTDWLDGTPLSQIISDGSEQERNRVGLLFTRFLFSGPTRAGMLHADPHPGNYRVTPDGRLGVLDFGLCSRMPKGFPPTIGRMLRIGLDEDFDTVVAGLRFEGFIRPGVEVDPDQLREFLGPFVEPARHETFRFTRDWMREQFQRVSDVGPRGTSLGLDLNIPPAYALIHRVWIGGIGVLCQLDAEAPFRDELEAWLPGFLDEHELPER